jgi:adenylosuccinate synthase
MSASIVVGAQWGDEGKGKIVDALAEKADFVVRFQGGANAGHTLVVKGEKTVLHLIPSGILHPQATCVIAPGCVVDIEGLIIEIEKLQASGVISKPSQLMVSDVATALLPFHKKLDAARETALAGNKIGTTGKGIGPAYEDRVARRAILFGDLFEPEILKEKLTKNLLEKNILLKNLYNESPIEVAPLLKQCEIWAEKLKPFRCKDVGLVLSKAASNRKKILFEGAQGTLLDVLHGTVPFVTSSSTIAASACTGTGIGPIPDRIRQ